VRAASSYASDAADIGSSMTPMIDVVFQLLIFFLCTASFQLPEQLLPTTLPPSGSATYTPSPQVQELELIRITLSQRGPALDIDLNGGTCGSVAELRDRLRQLLALAALPAVLDIGPEVEMNHVVTVYDTCLVAGLTDIHFAAPEK